MKVVNYLVTRLTNTRLGNHAVGFSTLNKVRMFTYHGNVICTVHDEAKTFATDYCGYEGYPSTTRAINEYKKVFKKLGYKDMEEMKNEIFNA